ncbi:MAG: hypothetical protein EBZ55_03140 [Actinobacteria bacterium]|nr:hypothetical protein [Actinomycetota bacterium]
MTSSSSLSFSSSARCLATQSHCRQAWLQNFLGRPLEAPGGMGCLHHMHFPAEVSLFCFVMTKR